MLREAGVLITYEETVVDRAALGALFRVNSQDGLVVFTAQAIALGRTRALEAACVTFAAVLSLVISVKTDRTVRDTYAKRDKRAGSMSIIQRLEEHI